MSDEEREHPGALVAGGSRELVAKTNTLAKRGLELAEAILAHRFTIPRVETPDSIHAAARRKKGSEDRILCVIWFRDPGQEIGKLTELYEALAEARREVGDEHVPFHMFADFVKGEVKKLRQGGSPEVAFRVAMENGKVSFRARAMAGAQDQTRSKTEAASNKRTTTATWDDAVESYLKNAG
jgi:hypothetical protein